VNAAHALGVQSPLKPVCSITLGPEGVSPLEMTDAFATLAAGGVRHYPEALASVAAPGQLPHVIGQPGTRVISKSVAESVTYALGGVVRGGTGTAAYFGRPMAGKTGTAENFNDAWFCGFVPQLATCVWIGYPQGEIPMQGLDGFGQVVGGSVPARIWHDFMSTTMQGRPVINVPMAGSGSVGQPPLPASGRATGTAPPAPSGTATPSPSATAPTGRGH
jgi:penicillin-binding protein 1A